MEEFFSAIFAIGMVIWLFYWLATAHTALLIVGIAVVMFCFFWVSKPKSSKPPKCPKCDSINIETHNTVSETYSTTRTETRQISHFNKDGDERGHSEYDVEVPHTKTLFVYVKKCNACSQKWYSKDDAGRDIIQLA